MKVGIIGAGGIAGAFSHRAVQAGHEVVMSNSRGPDSLTEIVAELGEKAWAGTVAQAGSEKIVFVAVPWSKIPKALRAVDDWNGKIVIDANNPIEAPEFKVAELNGRTSTEVFADLVPGASVVKAFNTLPPPVLRSDPRTSAGSRVIFMSGDDNGSKAVVSDLAESLGFAVVDLGGLKQAGQCSSFQPARCLP